MQSSRASDEEQGAASAGEAKRPGESAEAEQRSGTEQEAAQLRAQVAELDERWKRALADLDNYRKRSAREIDRRVAEEREQLLHEFLNVVDVVERALQLGSPGEPTYEGLRGLLEQLEASLRRHDVTRIGSAGEAFDPLRHEAVAVRDTDDLPPHTVVESVRSGFALGDRVLRPAQVVVSRPPQQRTTPEQAG
jgi:molecular chaperone GrpE